jgi:hypothetical protein
MFGFTHANIASATKCVHIAFEEISRLSMSPSAYSALLDSLNTYRNRWKATFFFYGPRCAMEALLLHSLEGKAHDRDFKDEFAIDVKNEEQIVIVYARYEYCFHPIGLWRVGETYLLIDCERCMTELLSFADGHGIARWHLEYAERQAMLMRQWVQKRPIARCHLCKGEYPLDIIQNARFTAEGGKLFLIFRCDRCKVNGFDSLDPGDHEA